MLNFADIPIIDHHAHNIIRPEIVAHYPYAKAFTEASDPQIINEHARQTLFYRRSLRDISRLLGCEAQESAILLKREKLGLEELTRQCFQAGKIETIVLDDGFLPQDILPSTWHDKFASVYRLIRLETLAETLFVKHNVFEDFVQDFRGHLKSLPDNVVGFKSITAYRCSLDIELISEKGAKACFDLLKNTFYEEPFRLSNKCLIDFLLLQALDIAAQSQIPIQFHTGFGDPDLDLASANPLLLRLILEDSRYKYVPIVLLHAAYPFTRELGYLASVYPQVYVDIGLAVPFLTVAGMRDTVQMLLELTPTSKILYSSDAHFIPELFYLGSLWGRNTLQQVLHNCVNDGDLTINEAEAIAVDILRENARKLYQIN